MNTTKWIRDIFHTRQTFLLLALSLASTLGGCANRLKANTSPDFIGKLTVVDQLGIVGGGTSAAIPAFQKAGYTVVDLGSGDDHLARARSKGIPFVASIDAVGTDGAWWDGFFDFSMRVTETKGDQIVWSAIGEYGTGGVFISQTKSTDEAMSAMVADFARSFPPVKSKEVAPPKNPTSSQTGTSKADAPVLTSPPPPSP